MIHVAGVNYPERNALIVAGRPGESTHPPGTWETPCVVCGATVLVDLVNHLLTERGVRAACLPCAARHYPNMIVGEVEGRAITMQEAVERGWLEIPSADPPKR